MAFHYSISYNPRTGGYHPVIVGDGDTMTFKELTKLISKRCTATAADAGAVLTAAAEVMAEVLTSGRAVRLDDLGYFRPKIKSTPVLSLEDFDVKKQVISIGVAFTPFRKKSSNGSFVRELIDTENLKWVLSASSKYKPGESSTTGTTTSSSEEGDTADAADTSETESSSESANSEEQVE